MMATAVPVVNFQRSVLKLPAYRGKGPPDAYPAQVRLVAQAQNWSQEETAVTMENSTFVHDLIGNIKNFCIIGLDLLKKWSATVNVAKGKLHASFDVVTPAAISSSASHRHGGCTTNLLAPMPLAITQQRKSE